MGCFGGARVCVENEPTRYDLKLYTMTARTHERMCVRWSPEETACLLLSIQMGRTVTEIAAEHRRSEAAVAYRLCKMAADYSKAGCSVEQICRLTGLSEEHVQKAIDWRRPGARAERRAAKAARTD